MRCIPPLAGTGNKITRQNQATFYAPSIRIKSTVTFTVDLFKLTIWMLLLVFLYTLQNERDISDTIFKWYPDAKKLHLKCY